MKLKQKNQSGFLLLEVLIGLFIIGTIIVIYQTSLQSIYLTRNSRDQDLALRIAEDEIETLRAAGYANIPASGSFSNSLISSLPNGSGAITVSAYNAKTKQIVATVTWKEPTTNVNHTVALTTLVTQIGGLK